MQTFDLTGAKQQGEISGDFRDVELSTARTVNKAAEIEMAGRFLFVELEAFDGVDAVDKSSTLTTGTAMVRFNSKTAKPHFIEAGTALEIPEGFDKIFVSNAAQSNKSLRLSVSATVKVAPYKTSFEIVTAAPETATPADSLNDVTTSATNIIAANANRKKILIQNNSSTDIKYCGTDSSATTGFIIPGGANAAYEDNATGALYALSTSGTITASDITIMDFE